MKITKQTEFTTKNYFEIDNVPLVNFTNVEHFTNGDKTVVVSFKNKKVVEGFFKSEEEFNFEQIMSESRKEKITQNPHTFEKQTKEPKLYFVNKEYLPYLKKYGQYGQLAKVAGEKELNLHDFENNKPFTDGANPNFEFIEFVQNKNGHIICKDNKGDLYMPPFVMDYIGAQIDNRSYHLDVLIEHLMNRDDVAFIVEKEWRKEIVLACPLKGNEEGINKIIRDIPSYNADEGRTETINIIYYPKTDAIEKIMNWKQDKENPEIWNVENYIMRVLLDCEKFRIQPIKDVEPAVPKRKFKS